MTWLAIASVYALLCVVYVLGHQLGYAKGRREAWSAAQYFHSQDVARVEAARKIRTERTRERAWSKAKAREDFERLVEERDEA